MSNPEFNNARGTASSLQSVPPFGFKGTTASVFPLQVNSVRLQKFVDRYLNQSSEHPSEVARFEVFLPYIYFMVIDYGKMSIEAANMGWVSQNEVAFGVPLRWMVKKDGEWVFHDWAINCPFIYVDNELSMTTGREVYGWPKVLSRIDPSISDWVKDPNGSRSVFEVSVQAFESSYNQSASEYRPFISVLQDQPGGALQVPVNLASLLDPVTRMPSLIADTTRMSVDVWKAFAGMALEGITGKTKVPDLLRLPEIRALFDADKDWLDPGNWRPGLTRILQSIYPRAAMNTVNLKQFRDASNPWEACYQALTVSQMGIESVNAGGLLGQTKMLLGNLDGGYRINITRHATQPVTDALGIIVDSSRTLGGVTVETVRPTLPFFVESDMSYGRGAVIASRSNSPIWRATDVSGSGDQTAAANASVTKQKPAQNKPLYNTARGKALQELAGPFELPNTTIRVLPLMADPTRLNQFVGEYLEVQGHARCEAWGSYVYLVASNYTLRSVETNDIGLFPARDVVFYVPVKRYACCTDSESNQDKSLGGEQPSRKNFLGVGMVAAFSFVNDPAVAITAAEVNGVPTLHSNLTSPPNAWMEGAGPADSHRQRLLSTSALVLPAIGVGAGASQEDFLGVDTGPVLPDHERSDWRRLVEDWGQALISDLSVKYSERGYRSEQKSEQDSFERMRAWALEALTGKISIDAFSLKQFRDSWEPETACYQAVVKRQTNIDRIHELHEIDESLHVHLTRYPTQPVADILGLKVFHRKAGSTVDVLQAVRPFWLRADISKALGETLYERTDEAAGWIPQPQQHSDRAASKDLMWGYRDLNHVDRVHVPDLRAFLNNTASNKSTSLEQAGQDADRVQPSTVLDTMLSRQWAKPADQRAPIHKPDFGLNFASFGPFAKKLFPQDERQGDFWPQSEDQMIRTTNERNGQARQLWYSVWELITLGTLNDSSYDAEARKVLPEWFHDSTAKPADFDINWSAEQWGEIAHDLRQLVDGSHYRVEWNTVIRPLDNWRKVAAGIAQDLAFTPKPNPARGGNEPDSVTEVLAGRLARLGTDG